MKKLKVLAVLFTLVTITNVNATILQSRPGAAAKTELSATDFFKYAREMEKEGGALGLNATFEENATTKEYEETSPSNNIDMHMVKNTEWGTVAMLSASEYGAGKSVSYRYDTTTNIYDVAASTTGNMTGVFGMSGGLASVEYVAGGSKLKISSTKYERDTKYLKYAALRYVDVYPEDTDYEEFNHFIPGDATLETKKVSNQTMYVNKKCKGIFGRGDLDDSASDWWLYVGPATGLTGSRGVVWVGEGL